MQLVCKLIVLSHFLDCCGLLVTGSNCNSINSACERICSEFNSSLSSFAVLDAATENKVGFYGTALDVLCATVCLQTLSFVPFGKLAFAFSMQEPYTLSKWMNSAVL